MQSRPEFTRMPGGHDGPPVISAFDVRDRISMTYQLERLSRHQQALGLTETLCFNNQDGRATEEHGQHQPQVPDMHTCSLTHRLKQTSLKQGKTQTDLKQVLPNMGPQQPKGGNSSSTDECIIKLQYRHLMSYCLPTHITQKYWQLLPRRWILKILSQRSQTKKSTPCRIPFTGHIENR